MRRFTKAAAIIFAGALVLTGCSGQAGDDLGDEIRESVGANVSESAAALKDAACERITARIQEISTGVQERLETATTETRSEVEAFVDDAADQVDELLADVENQELADAVEDFAEEVRESVEYTAGLSDPGAANEDELAQRREELQDAVAEIEAACTPDE